MGYIRRLFSFATLLIVCSFTLAANAGSPLPLPENERSHRVGELQTRLANEVPKLRDRMKQSPDGIEVRNVTNGALFLLVAGKDAKEAEQWLHTAYDRQEMKSGADFGRMPWNLGDKDVKDANSIDFATQSLGPILAGHASQLSPELIEYIRPHAKAALIALEKHDVPVSYTNIFLMNTVNTILIAEWLHDDKQAARGYRQFDQWFAYTSEAGIHEFDSPTYSAVSMDSLLMGYQYSARPEARQKFKAALDYLWSDLAASYFAPAHRLAGSHSRDYDFLFGYGRLDSYLYIEGFNNEGNTAIDFEKSLFLESSRPGGYRLNSDIVNLPSERIITQRWDKNSAKTRYTYITPLFAIGTANGDYGPQDKMFAVDFPSFREKDLPTISIVTTSTDIPYGKDRHKDRSGHAKPKHLSGHYATVQDKGLALVAVDIDPKQDRNANRISIDVVLPAQAMITINSQSISPDPQLFRKLSVKDVIGVRVGEACFAIRSISVDGDMRPAQVLQADEDGLRYGALRFTSYFQPSPNDSHNEHLRIGYVAAAERCTDNRNNIAVEHLQEAKVGSPSTANLWRLSAQSESSSLDISYDLNTRSSSSTRVSGKELKGKESETAPLRINGKAISLFQGQ